MASLEIAFKIYTAVLSLRAGLRKRRLQNLHEETGARRIMILLWRVLDFLATETLYRIYRGVMWLKARRDHLPWYVKIPGYLFAVVGYGLDILYNIVFGSVQFKDFPQELTYTARLKRYKYQYPVTSWRHLKALHVCARLDPYDPAGEHCGDSSRKAS